jgi:hypothetical protein
MHPALEDSTTIHSIKAALQQPPLFNAFGRQKIIQNESHRWIQVGMEEYREPIFMLQCRSPFNFQLKYYQ